MEEEEAKSLKDIPPPTLLRLGDEIIMLTVEDPVCPNCGGQLCWNDPIDEWVCFSCQED